MPEGKGPIRPNRIMTRNRNDPAGFMTPLRQVPKGAERGGKPVPAQKTLDKSGTSG